MEIFKTLKTIFFHFNHNYVIMVVRTEHLRKGTMIIDLMCKECGHTITTFHDLTETERIIYRHPLVEDLLYEQGYLVKKKGKMYTNLKWTTKPEKKIKQLSYKEFNRLPLKHKKEMLIKFIETKANQTK